MKAVLVIDIPDYLNVEDVKIKYELFEKSEDKQIVGNYTLNDLKPMPKKIDANDWQRMFSGTYEERQAKGYGYNACIDEILGEEE